MESCVSSFCVIVAAVKVIRDVKHMRNRSACAKVTLLPCRTFDQNRTRVSTIEIEEKDAVSCPGKKTAAGSISFSAIRCNAIERRDTGVAYKCEGWVGYAGLPISARDWLSICPALGRSWLSLRRRLSLSIDSRGVRMASASSSLSISKQPLSSIFLLSMLF